MNVRYSLGDYTLKVLGCDKSLDVLDFYYRNRNDFDIYESDKPEAFYTEESSYVFTFCKIFSCI